MRTNTITLDAESYEFLVDESETCVGLKLRLRDGFANALHSVIIPFNADDALNVGALLVAHSDYLAGREPRRWQ